MLCATKDCTALSVRGAGVPCMPSSVSTWGVPCQKKSNSHC